MQYSVLPLTRIVMNVDRFRGLYLRCGTGLVFGEDNGASRLMFPLSLSSQTLRTHDNYLSKINTASKAQTHSSLLQARMLHLREDRCSPFVALGFKCLSRLLWFLSFTHI